MTHSFPTRRSSDLLYEIESEIRDLKPDLRRRIRQEKAVPVMDRLHAWMIAQRELVHDSAAIAEALDYSLKRWPALSRYLYDRAVPIDNRSEEHTSELQSLMRSSYAVFYLNK